MSRRILLQAGFDRLLPYYTPEVAGERIEDAWHERRLQLYCNGRLLLPGYIKSEVQLLVGYEDDGRPRCHLRPAGPLGWEPISYMWEIDAEGIETLLPPLPGKRGRKSIHNWTDIVDRKLIDMRFNGSPLLKNSGDFDALCAHVAAHLQDEIGREPPDPKRFRKRIRGFLRGQIKK